MDASRGPDLDDFKTGGRRSILEAHPYLEAAADHLQDGLTALLAGDTAAADAHFAATHFSWPALAEAGRRNVHERLARPGAPTCDTTSKERTRRVTIPDWARNAVFVRDGWRCRYCGLRVIPATSRAAIVASLGERFAWGSSDLDRHPALAALSATLDHVEAQAAGGEDNVQNLATACWTCQFQKGSYSLEALGLDHPSEPDAHVTGWDGLERVSQEVAMWAARQGRGWKGTPAHAPAPPHDENPDVIPVAT